MAISVNGIAIVVFVFLALGHADRNWRVGLVWLLAALGLFGLNWVLHRVSVPAGVG